MKRLIILALVATSFLVSCRSSKQVLLHINRGPDIERQALAGLLEKYKNYSVVYLTKSTEIEHWGSYGEWQYQYSSFQRYLVINPNDYDYNVFKFSNVDEKSMYKVRLKLILPDGTTKTYNKSDIKQTTDSDGSTLWRLAYPAVVKGSVIEEEVIIRKRWGVSRMPTDQSLNIQRESPILNYSFKLAVPDWWAIQFKQTHPDSLPLRNYKHDKKSNKKIFSYTATNIPAYKEEPYAPYYRQDGLYLDWLVKELIMDVGGATYFRRANRSWTDVSSTFHDYAVDNDKFFSRRVGKKTRAIIKGLSDSLPRFEAIISYIQRKIKPEYSDMVNSFPDVLKYKKGDPFIITGLAKKMLDIAGIQSDYLLIHPAKNGYFDRKYYTLDEVRNPALRVHLNQHDYLVFPYEKFMDYRLIHPFFLDQDALLLPTDLKYNSPVRIVKTPAKSLRKNSYDIRLEARIDEEGLIDVSETRRIDGIRAYYLRTEIEDMDKDTRTELMEEMITQEEGDLKFIDFEIKNSENYDEPLTFIFHYSLDNLVNIMPDEVIFQTAGLFAPVNTNKLKFDPGERQHRVVVNMEEINSKSIIIHFPGSWKIQTPLEDFSYENEYGNSAGRFSTENGTLSATFSSHVQRREGPREDIGKLMEVKNNQNKLAIPDIVFIRGGK
ncbi:MAG TPA: DUF3857 domain-containing protein [Caldithrix abyssi]|uniref:DUF3857 domain-containing protein n=1 Tax=Caldithrix abyssi TaxID=187145 RepID=A0A7V1M0Y1_CALAY|nr:DUF3857 domain-containing protein [Caldithrix abyssi]